MKVEIEIKLRLAGELAQVRADVRKLGFRINKRRIFESNILFDNVKRTLRKHGKLLRVRRVGQRGLRLIAPDSSNAQIVFQAAVHISGG